MIIGVTTALGLAIGSFLNVVVYRVPAGKSIVRPPSACPHCGAAIRRRDNIPVLSWLILRGRCRDCGGPIAVRYPLVEAGTAVLFALVAVRFGGAIVDATDALQLAAAMITLVAFLYLAAVSIALALIDLDTRRLPDVLVLPAYIVLAVLLSAASLLSGDPLQLAFAFGSMAALYLFYLALALAYRGGMGRGDIKLAGVLGLSLGWLGLDHLAVGVFAPFLLGGLFALALLIARRAGRKSKIPFGPWMLLGAWVGILVGDTVFHAYRQFAGLA